MKLAEFAPNRVMVLHPESDGSDRENEGSP